MKVMTVDGKEVEISMAEAQKVHQAMAGHTGKADTAGSAWRGDPGKSDSAGTYAELTQQLMADAQNELREATGDFPENMKELFDFAVKHEIFGDREETHIMFNYFKVFYCLLQKETHDVQDE